MNNDGGREVYCLEGGGEVHARHGWLEMWR